MTTVLPLVSQKPFYSGPGGIPVGGGSSATLKDFSNSLGIPSNAAGSRVSSETRSSPVSIRKASPRIHDENDPLNESLLSRPKGNASEQLTLSTRSSGQSTPKSAFDTANQNSPDLRTLYLLHQKEEVDVSAGCGEPYEKVRGRLQDVSNKDLSVVPSSDTPLEEKQRDGRVKESDELDKLTFDASGANQPNPPRRLRRWMSVLRRKNAKYKPKPELAVPETTLEDVGDDFHGDPVVAISQRRSSSHSSRGLVNAVKHAGAGLVNHGLGLTSRKNGVSSHRRSWARSSGSSNAQVRSSDENTSVPRALLYDEAVWRRATRRRRILGELISSEESYIGDLKILVNVYFGLLASVPTIPEHARTSIRRNVMEILALHENLLGELQRVVPHSDNNQRHSYPARPASQRAENGLLSENEANARNTKWARLSFDLPRSDHLNQIGITAEPTVAKEVARIFSSLLKRFFIYEEYGAKYELLVQNIGSTYKTIPTWHAYERGIEALANSLASTGKHEARKGLTFEDLIIKPIQRVCKYPLFFAELYKATPVYDCPESHAELEKVLYRLREVTAEINKATHDPQTRDRIEKTWLLQDRLIFPDQIQASHMVTLRLLGRVILCGVLHIAWQTRGSVRGGFMVCILFRSYLVLATAKESGQSFAVVACIDLEGVKIEQADSGKGLQCQTALFTWKVLFESDLCLFEMILSACSAKEAEAWKTALHDRSVAERSGADESLPKSPNLLAFLSLDIKPIGQVFGQLGTLARRISIQRASTVGSKSSISQVIIKNTHAPRDGLESQSPSDTPINRSQSLLSTARIPVLTPRRVERIRLEHALADLWTRDVIPYPGMGGRRGEYLIKASASSMMRKLSIASITSTFTKRSTSFASLAYSEKDYLSSIADDPVGEPRAEAESTMGRRNDSSDSISSSKRQEMLEEETAKEMSVQVFGMDGEANDTVIRRPLSPKKTKAGLLPSSKGQGQWITFTGEEKDVKKDDRPRKGTLTRKLTVDGIRKRFK